MMGEIPKEALAYIAGIVDGEGFVGILRTKPGKTHMLNPRYTPRVSISMTRKEPLDYIRSFFGGALYLRHRGNSRHKACWDLHFSSDRVEVILKEILPFLRIKKTQAEVVLSLKQLQGKSHSNRTEKKSHIWKGGPAVGHAYSVMALSPHTVAQYEELYRACRIAQVRGGHPPASIFLGIDVGLRGGLAIINETETVGANICVFDTPLIDGRVDPWALARLLRPYEIREDQQQITAVAVLEDVHAFPREGVCSSFSFGRSLGICEGVLAAMSIPYEKVNPRAWRKVFFGCDGSHGKTEKKEASRVKAIELFPTIDLSLKKHHGRAESLLLAEYARRTFGRLAADSLDKTVKTGV